jgi:PhnB protein
LNAKEKHRFGSGNKVHHAELQIGDGGFMLSDAMGPDHETRTAEKPYSSFGLYIYVPDVDAAVEQAVAAGCKLDRKVNQQFYVRSKQNMHGFAEREMTIAYASVISCAHP